MNNRMPTAAMGLPPALANMMRSGTPVPQQSPNPNTGISSGMMAPGAFVPSYQQGGMIGPGGMPTPPGSVGLAPQNQMPQGPMSPQMLQMEVSRVAGQNPQGVAQLRNTIVQLMQTGELTQQELNMMVQLATVAAQNPDMYPYVRRFAVQQGLATEQDLPQQYDQGLVFTILMAARAIQADVGGQNMMQGGGPQVSASQVSSGPIPSMARGGPTPDSKKSDGSVLINAHEGEYVIPAHIVKAKGTEFFDRLIGKTSGAT